MNSKDRLIMQKMLKYAREALSYVEGMDYDAFIIDSKTLSATAFVLGQIGELAGIVSNEFQSTAVSINWRGMRGLRNRIVHDYEAVDLKMLWDVIHIDLPELLVQIENYLSEKK